MATTIEFRLKSGKPVRLPVPDNANPDSYLDQKLAERNLSRADIDTIYSGLSSPQTNTQAMVQPNSQVKTPAPTTPDSTPVAEAPLLTAGDEDIVTEAVNVQGSVAPLPDDPNELVRVMKKMWVDAGNAGNFFDDFLKMPNEEFREKSKAWGANNRQFVAQARNLTRAKKKGETYTLGGTEVIGDYVDKALSKYNKQATLDKRGPVGSFEAVMPNLSASDEDAGFISKVIESATDYVTLTPRVMISFIEELSNPDTDLLRDDFSENFMKRMAREQVDQNAAVEFLSYLVSPPGSKMLSNVASKLGKSAISKSKKLQKAADKILTVWNGEQAGVVQASRRETPRRIREASAWAENVNLDQTVGKIKASDFAADEALSKAELAVGSYKRAGEASARSSALVSGKGLREAVADELAKEAVSAEATATVRQALGLKPQASGARRLLDLPANAAGLTKKKYGQYTRAFLKDLSQNISKDVTFASERADRGDVGGAGADMAIALIASALAPGPLVAKDVTGYLKLAKLQPSDIAEAGGIYNILKNIPGMENVDFVNKGSIESLIDLRNRVDFAYSKQLESLSEQQRELFKNEIDLTSFNETLDGLIQDLKKYEGVDPKASKTMADVEQFREQAFPNYSTNKMIGERDAQLDELTTKLRSEQNYLRGESQARLAESEARVDLTNIKKDQVQEVRDATAARVDAYETRIRDQRGLNTEPTVAQEKRAFKKQLDAENKGTLRDIERENVLARQQATNIAISEKRIRRYEKSIQDLEKRYAGFPDERVPDVWKMKYSKDNQELVRSLSSLTTSGHKAGADRVIGDVGGAFSRMISDNDQIPDAIKSKFGELQSKIRNASETKRKYPDVENMESLFESATRELMNGNLSNMKHYNQLVEYYDTSKKDIISFYQDVLKNTEIPAAERKIAQENLRYFKNTESPILRSLAKNVMVLNKELTPEQAKGRVRRMVKYLAKKGAETLFNPDEWNKMSLVSKFVSRGVRHRDVIISAIAAGVREDEIDKVLNLEKERLSEREASSVIGIPVSEGLAVPATLDGFQARHVPSLKMIGEVARKYKATLNSGTEGEYGDGLHIGKGHYDGQAIDLRTTHLTKQQAAKMTSEMRESLGPDWQVIIHGVGPHMHIEYKGD